MSVLGPASKITRLSDWWSYRNVTAEGVVRLAGNGLMAVIEYRGPNLPISPNHDMRIVSDETSRRIGDHGKQDGWTINPMFHNFEAEGYLLPEPHIFHGKSVAKIGGSEGYIDAVRHRRFSGRLFENRTFLAISYRPNSVYAEKLESIIKKNVRSEYAEWKRYIKKFKDEISTTADFLHDLMSTGSGWARICTADEIMSILSFEIDGKKASIAFPDGAASCSISQHVDGRISWDRNLRLCERPPVFIRCIGIKGSPEFHYPEMLTSLRTLGFTFKLSQRFSVVGPDTLNNTRKKKLRLIEDSKHGVFANIMGFFTPGGKKAIKGDSMAEERAAVAEADIRSEAFARCGGYLTTSAVTWGVTPDEAQEKANEIKKKMLSLGFKSDIEDDNEFQAYIGSFPGQVARNKRKDLLTEKFCAYRTPLSSPWTGANKGGSEFGGPPISQCVTQGAMPFRFDFFSRENGGGHGVMFGQNGSGKSTVARLLGKQFIARFRPMFPNAGVIDYDIDSEKSSSVVACLSSGGNYISLKHGQSRLQPLRDIEDPEARLHATFILRSICEVQGFPYTARIGEGIEKALNLLAHMPKHMRTMSMFRVQSDIEELRHALGDYCDGGIFGSLMDGCSEGFKLSPWTLLEMGEFVTKDARARPIISAVLFETQRALDGSAPKLLIVDEAAVMCMALGAEQLIKWLAECRKKLGIIVFCFHTIDSTLTREGITEALMTQCDWKMFFPRGDARDPKVRAWMEGFGVTDLLANDLANATGRQVLMIQGDRKKAMIDFVIGKEELALCGVNGSLRNARAMKLFEEVGPDRFWIEHLKGEGFKDAEEIVENWVAGSRDRFGRTASDGTDGTDIRRSIAYGIAAE